MSKSNKEAEREFRGARSASPALLLTLMAMVLTACSRGPVTSELPGDSVIKGISYIGASVSDLAQTIELYRDAVDLELVDQSPISSSSAFDQLAGRDGVVANTAMMRSVNAQIRFMSFDDPSAAARRTAPMEVIGPGIMHVCFQVDEKTQAYQKFLAGGARFMGVREMQQLNERNPVFYAYARDFDELVVELEHVDVEQLALPAPPKNQYRIRQVALATPDMDRLTDFYSVLLGQPKFRSFGKWFFMRLKGEKFDNVAGLDGGAAEAAWFQVRNLELEIFQFHSHPTQDLETPRPLEALGYNMIVFDVSDMAEARELFLRAGGTIVTEPAPMDGGEIMFGRDPDGNLLGLQQSPAEALVSSRIFKNNGIE
ncbi:MAG: VOC family protein [Pseudomonadota bacterium]